jgi:hypothetical protein
MSVEFEDQYSDIPQRRQHKADTTRGGAITNFIKKASGGLIKTNRGANNLLLILTVLIFAAALAVAFIDDDPEPGNMHSLPDGSQQY